MNVSLMFAIKLGVMKYKLEMMINDHPLELGMK